MKRRLPHSAFGLFLRILRWAMVLALVPALRPVSAMAGGGPENLLLVVNPTDAASLSIANYYVHLRKIPLQNVLYLPWDAEKQMTDIDAFRRQILEPVLKAIQARGLAVQIDYVAYSSGFPYAVNARADVDRFLIALKESEEKKEKESPSDVAASRDDAVKPPEWPKVLTYVGSISGLTYLWQGVMSGEPGYMLLRSNGYAQRALPHKQQVSTLGFRGLYEFGRNGQLVTSGGRRYFLSVVLGVTDGRGNTLDEVVHCLDRSRTADGTHPPGTIYYMKNTDIRSRVRDDLFPLAVRLLEEAGVAAQIVEGIAPRNKPDVQGVMMGTADFDWASTGSTILPGAICDHFTSYGGALDPKVGQTPLTVFLRYGAAGASGTVIEPYAVAEKFPNAMVQVHYARGCTLAEALYQSILGPYQLLIVGDPLCRPWANIPEVAVEGVEPKSTVRGKIELIPTATAPGGSSVERFELYVDGSRAAECKPGGRLEFDTRRVPDGYHEIRVVAFEAGPIRSQGRRILSVFSANRGGQITVSATPERVAAQDEPIIVTAESPGAAGLAVLSNTRVLERISGPAGKFEIDPAALGVGPVRLQVVALGKSGPSSNVIAEPIALVIRPPAKPPATQPDPAAAK